MIICDACDLGYDLQCLGDTDSANDPDFNVLEDDCLGHVVLVMLAVMTLKQMAATMKVLAQIRVPMPVNKLATLQDAEAMLYAK